MAMFAGYSNDFADYQRPTITLPSYYELTIGPIAGSASVGTGAAADHMRDRPKKEQSDEFLMYTFKVKSCAKKKSHDWTECPYAHRGEKARRRDPRKFPYSAIVCPEYRQRGDCCRGQACEYAHGVFEFWLHPARYRTKMCDAGPACPRKICFFAHAPEQLRPAAVQYCMRCGGSVCLGNSTEGGENSDAAAGGCTGACRGNSSEEIDSLEAAYCGSTGSAGSSSSSSSSSSSPPASSSTVPAAAKSEIKSSSAAAAAASPSLPYHAASSSSTAAAPPLSHHASSAATAAPSLPYHAASSSSTAAAAAAKGDGNGFASVDDGDSEEEDYASFPHLDWILDIVK